jgi:NADPH-dependent curcumin reductase CurA
MKVVSREIQLLVRPEGMPSLEQFAVVERELASPCAGEFLVRNEYMSIDPAMRPRLSNGTTAIGQPIVGATVGTVIESLHSGFAPGDAVLHNSGFREFLLTDGKEISKIHLQDEPLQAHLSVLGVAGLTAYAGLLEVAALKEGERVFVSAAAGAVGSLAAQIAKIKGCYTVGSAGSDEKCGWLRDVAGLDAVINYKTVVLRKALKEAAPEGIDVFFDNVGGEHLNAALPRMRMLGRIAVCGMISAYNSRGAISEGVTTLSNMMYNRLTMRGFVVWDFEQLRPQFLADMRGWLADGKVKYEETVYKGIASAPAALIGIMEGKNLGKMLVQLA